MICSSAEEDVVAPHARRAPAPAAAATATAAAAAAGEPLRPLAPADDMLSSVRSSLVSNTSVTDLKRDQHPGLFMHTGHHAAAGSSASSSPSTTRSAGGHMRASAPSARAHGVASASAPSGASSSSSRSKRARFENKIRLLAQYMKTLSMGLSHRQHRAPPATVGSHSQQQPQRGPVPQMVKRRSQVSLSQYSLPRSAPDVLDPNKSARSLLNGSAEPSRDAAAAAAAAPVTRNSSSSQQTALSWDEIIAGAVFVEENEVMPASPRSRKRGRPCSELFEDNELRRLFKQCGVPAENMDEVVKMVNSQFGTCQLDLTVLHELVGGNSVVVIGMLVFSCIDCGEELLDLHSLPAFLLHIQSRYDSKNPFHNACHAADVLHSFFTALWMSELGGRIAVHNQIGALFAAIMHDIDHIGLSNDFLLKTNHEIAAKYQTRAPMEEMHAAVALDLLTDSKYNVLTKLCNDQLEQVMKIVRETIQSTALCYQKDLLRDVAAVSPSEWDVATSDVLPLHVQVVALRCVMHVSDISQTMKPFAIHQKWVLRLNEEQFMQGDLDAKMQLAVCPDSFYRHKWSQDAFLSSQIWFLENMALPAAKSFNSIPLLNVPPLEANLQANIIQWRAQLSGKANP